MRAPGRPGSATLDVWNALLRAIALVTIWPARVGRSIYGRYPWVTVTTQVAAPRSSMLEVADASAVPDNGPLYHYCIIRPDLPRGVEGSQVGHAYAHSNHLGLALPEDTHNVLLSSCPKTMCRCNGQHLLELEQYLIGAALPHICIREPDLPWNGAAMAIGIHPAPKPLIGHHFRHLQCIK